VTLPALMQDVQTFKRLGVLPTMARTVWMFGFQRRLVRTCECEIECPKPGPLPQTSQLAATVVVLTVDGFVRIVLVRRVAFRPSPTSPLRGDRTVPGNRSRLQGAGRKPKPRFR